MNNQEQAKALLLKLLGPSDDPQAIAAQVNGFMADPLLTWLVPSQQQRVT